MAAHRRWTLSALLAFLALNALGGGIYGIAGAEEVSTTWLAGSVFATYLVPSIVLLVVVGGALGFAAAAVLVPLRSARVAATAAAAVLLAWIAVQVAVIGYVSWMQPAILMASIAVLGLVPWATAPLVAVPAGSRRAHPAVWRMTVAIIPAAVVASTVGLVRPTIYRDAAWLVPQSRGQDLVTLLCAFGLCPLALAMRRGSARATLLSIGLLGYVLYTYVGAAFAYAYNPLFLVYVALFALSAFALAAVVRTLDVAGLGSHFDDGTPRRATSAFLFALVGLLTVLWLGQLIPALFTGETPESIVRSNGGLKFVFALDLGIVVPLAALAGLWLLRRKAWGVVLAAVVLVKASTMGLALLSMAAFSIAAGQPAESGLMVVWAVLASGSIAMSTWLLRHCA